MSDSTAFIDRNETGNRSKLLRYQNKESDQVCRGLSVLFSSQSPIVVSTSSEIGVNPTIQGLRAPTHTASISSSFLSEASVDTLSDAENIQESQYSDSPYNDSGPNNGFPNRHRGTLEKTEPVLGRTSSSTPQINQVADHSSPDIATAHSSFHQPLGSTCSECVDSLNGDHAFKIPRSDFSSNPKSTNKIDGSLSFIDDRCRTDELRSQNVTGSSSFTRKRNGMRRCYPSRRQSAPPAAWIERHRQYADIPMLPFFHTESSSEMQTLTQKWGDETSCRISAEAKFRAAERAFPTNARRGRSVSRPAKFPISRSSTTLPSSISNARKKSREASHNCGTRMTLATASGYWTPYTGKRSLLCTERKNTKENSPARKFPKLFEYEQPKQAANSEGQLWIS